MRFGYPWLLILVALVPILGCVAAFLHARRTKALSRIAATPPKARWEGLQSALLLTGLALCLVALARPRWGVESVRQVSRSRDVIVAIDVSRSMRAKDVHPNRLERVKKDVSDLIDSLASTDDGGKTVKDRCALVAFRADGQAVCPLTDDQAFLKEQLRSISEDSASPGETSLGAGIEKALALINEGDGDDEDAAADHSAIILISDGGDLASWALDSAKLAKKRGVPIFTVGIGDPSNAVPIPLEDGSNLTTFNDEGKRVVVDVRLDPESLKRIAEASGGRYINLATAQTTNTSLGDIYRDFLRQVAVKEQNAREDRLGDRYQWFLVPGLVLLLAGAALSRGRYRLNMKRRQ